MQSFVVVEIWSGVDGGKETDEEFKDHIELHKHI